MLHMFFLQIHNALIQEMVKPTIGKGVQFMLLKLGLMEKKFGGTQLLFIIMEQLN